MIGENIFENCKRILLYTSHIGSYFFLLRLIFKTKGKESNNILFGFALFLFSIWFLLTTKNTFYDLNTKIKGTYLQIIVIQTFSPLIFYPILFLKRRKLKTRWIFFAGLSISYTYWFEMFVIHITSIHRDFILSKTIPKSSFLNLVYYFGLFEKMVIGLILGSIIFFSFEYRKKYSTTLNNKVNSKKNSYSKQKAPVIC